jgi:hypothetical protein
MTLKVSWIDRGREPQCEPNPAYPNGIDVDFSKGASATCSAKLDYPAPRCGYHVVECATCKQRVVITTAGRIDDPRSVKIPCRGH